MEGKKVLVVGTGKSGIAAATLLHEVKAVPVMYDENEKVDREAVIGHLPEGCRPEILTGNFPKGRREEFSLVVMSPGVPVETPFVEGFVEKKIPVWGELELGYAFLQGRLAAITGTNGKTTTTALVGQILADHYASVFVVGNIGDPITHEALLTRPESVTVAEVSSFQLETARRFHPAVSAILNITPDHLNRHHTMDNYVAVKESIAKNQTKEDMCVLNYMDPYTRAFGKRCPARTVWFSSGEKPEEGYYLEEDEIWYRGAGMQKRLLNMHETLLPGIHNAENIMAAIAVSSALGVPMEEILETVRRFKAVEHRIEYVATKHGVVYYNDSKGTNPDAAIRGIRAMDRPTILIGGGYDKGSSYDEWIESFGGRVKLLVLIGQTKEKIAECAKNHGLEQVILADTFEECMELCVKNAVPGDAVLLSPACASWGMFPNYEARGNIFKEYVNSLKE